MSIRVENSGSVDPKDFPSRGRTNREEQSEEIIVFSEDDKKITREVDNAPREIRIGYDENGNKRRYTDDTHEELVTVSKSGKNTYLTKAEFDRRIKEMLNVDYLPTGIRAEYRNGNIIFINNETNETMTASEIRNNEEILALREQKKFNDTITANQEALNKASTDALHSQIEVPSPNFSPIDETKLSEISNQISEEQFQRYKKEQEAFKIDPNWYTAQGVKNLEREWSTLAPKSRGFTHEFYQGIVGIAKQMQCNPDDLMSLINSESSFRPDLETGLMGFISDTRKAYDFEPSKLSPVEQLPYIRNCLKDCKTIVFGKNSKHALSPGELYSIIFLPGRFKKALDAGDEELVLTRKNDRYHPEFYSENEPLDKDGKKYITVQDMAQRIEDFNAYNTCKKYHIAYRGTKNVGTDNLPETKPRLDEKLAKGKNVDNQGNPKTT